MASSKKAERNAKRKAAQKRQAAKDTAMAEGRRIVKEQRKVQREKFKKAKAEGKEFPGTKKQQQIKKARVKAGKHPDYCGAKKRDGSHCARSAGWGTNHPGRGRCKHHTGSTYKGEVAAAASAIGLTRPLHITPAQGLLGVLHLAAGQLAYVNERVAEIG